MVRVEFYSKDTVLHSAKVYVNSYGEDLFGRKQSGCAIIRYEDLNDKRLLDDIKVENVTCNSAETFVKVVKVDDQYGYSASIGCGVEKNGVVTIQTNLNDGVNSEDFCGSDVHTIMSFSASPESSTGIQYQQRNVKAIITSPTGVHEDYLISYGFSKSRNTNIIGGSWGKVELRVPGGEAQKETISKGRNVVIPSENMVTPDGQTGDIYLVLRVDKLEDLGRNPWTTDPEQSNVFYFGPYKLDNTKPDFKDSTVVSSTSG